jgi:hypothetical protein
MRLQKPTKRFGMADCVGIPQQFDLPKAFQTIRDANRLAFFILVSLHKRACDAASNEKSLSLS